MTQCAWIARPSDRRAEPKGRHDLRMRPGMTHVEPRVTPETTDELRSPRASWFSVFAGTVIAISVSVILNLLGFAVGITTIDPAGESPTFDQFQTGAWIWMLAAGIVALLVGGWVTGRLTGMPRRINGLLHGLVTWAVFSTISFLLMMSVAGQIVNTATRTVGAAFSAAAQTAQAVGKSAEVDVSPQGIELGSGEDPVEVAWKSVWSEANQILEQTETEQLAPETIQEDLQEAGEEMEQAAQAPSSEAAREELQAALGQLRQSARETAHAVDQDAVINVLTARTDMSEAEARETVQRWTLMFQKGWSQAEASLPEMKNVRQTAVQTAEAATDAIARVSWWTFSYMLLTLGAAAVGGFLGGHRPRRTVHTRVEEGHPERTYPVTEEHSRPPEDMRDA